MVHETIISIFAGMAVGLVVRLAPGTLIREMLVSAWGLIYHCHDEAERESSSDVDVQAHSILQLTSSTHHPQLRLRTQAG